VGLAVIQVEMQVRGVNGQVTLLSDRLQIKRAGAMARLTQARNGDKDILIGDLSGVRIQLPSLLSNGYIRFFLVNGEPAEASLIRAASDAHTILFNGRQLSRFTLLKTALEKKIAANQPPPILLLPAPALIEPVDVDAALVEAEIAEPTIIEAEVVEPVVAEPVIAEPVIVEPVIVEPVIVEPVIVEPVIAEPVITAPVIVAGRPPVDFDQLDRVAEQYKQGLISRSEWIATKRKLLGL
jgi:Domain of unknown function (DUF4429)